MNLLEIIDQYSVKKDRKIKKICEPLSHLGIPYLWYYFLDDQGNFGAISNDPDYAYYYMDSKLHLNCPYYADPSFFRSGYTFLPGAFNEGYQLIKEKYKMDHLFFVLKANSTWLEGFTFYERNLDEKNLSFYLNNLDLIEKFICYFKREARELIDRQKCNLFNIKKEIGNKFVEKPGILPLIKHDLKIKTFLKEVYGLTPQEERCHELLKQGYTAHATASLLSISCRTVETHIDNIKIKFNCKSKWELLNN